MPFLWNRKRRMEDCPPSFGVWTLFPPRSRMSIEGQSRSNCSKVCVCAAGIRETVTNGSCVVRF